MGKRHKARVHILSDIFRMKTLCSFLSLSGTQEWTHFEYFESFSYSSSKSIITGALHQHSFIPTALLTFLRLWQPPQGLDFIPSFVESKIIHFQWKEHWQSVKRALAMLFYSCETFFVGWGYCSGTLWHDHSEKMNHSSSQSINQTLHAYTICVCSLVSQCANLIAN